MILLLVVAGVGQTKKNKVTTVVVGLRAIFA